ncbi:MAG: hypothetical protein NVS3B2_01160 [Ramlibacter sp.]
MRIDIAKRMGLAATVASLALVAMTGCAGFGKPATPQEQVKARAQQRADALVKRDFARAYEFFTPAYRAAVSADTYRNSIGNALVLVSSQVESVECESLEKCIAKVRVETKPLVVPRFTGTITTYADETWLLEAGQWWFFQKL